MGRVIYLTGAPATGKSTLCERLSVTVEGLITYSYSALLRDYINRAADKNLDEVEIRAQSAKAVTKEAVEAVDSWLIEEVAAKRNSHHIIIDSHPVTKEKFGFRITPFSEEQFKCLAPDSIVCLYASPDVIQDRIQNDAQGRPLPEPFDLALHIELQASLAAQYSFALGKPCYLIDASESVDHVAGQVKTLAHLDGEEN